MLLPALPRIRKLKRKKQHIFCKKKFFIKSKSGNNKMKKKEPEYFESKTIKVSNPRELYNLYTDDFSNLESSQVKNYFEAARKGLNFWKSLLFEEIKRRDLHIGGVCLTRKISICGKSYSIKFEEDSPVPEAQQKEIIAFVKKNLKNIHFTNLLTDCIEAQLQGVSLFEIIYKVVGDKLELKDVRLIPNHLVCYDDQQDIYKFLDIAQAGAFTLRTASSASNQDRVDLSRLPLIELDQENKLLEVHSFDGNEQNGFLNGAIDGLIWAYLFKNYGVKDFASYVEKFASPSVLGKYDPLMNPQDRNTLFNAVKNFGKNFFAIIPNSAEIEFPGDQAKGDSSQLFKTFIDYLDSAISVRVLGQDMTTKQGQAGSFAKAKVGDMVRADFALADMLLVKESVNTLIKKLLDLNYDNLEDYPGIVYEEEVDDNNLLIKCKILICLKELGYEPEQEELESLAKMKLVKITDTKATIKNALAAYLKDKKFTDSSTGEFVPESEIDPYLAEIFKEVEDVQQ
jgi:phage gp29-like protein